MLDLSNFLGKYKAVENAGDKKQKVISLIKEAVGIQLRPDEIMAKNHVIYIKTSSVIKSEVFMRKGVILKVINDRLGEAFVDIV